jgi:hypothetical protein
MESASLSPVTDPARPIRAIGAVLFSVTVFILVACMVKDKNEKVLRSGGMTPPWDSTHFTPKSLEGYVYSGPESTFSVFGKIAEIDSLCGSRTSWTIDSQAIDTMRVSQLYDTAFLFPESPEATMAYGFDDSFREDTLYRKAYGNGLFTQDNPCATTIILSSEFLHPARWLHAGLGKDDIIKAMGTPLYNQPGVLRYFARHRSVTPTSQPQGTGSNADGNAYFDVFEGANLYFQGDSLFSAVLQKSRPCH